MAHYDNVILFGAGASFDAGIPLLDTFVDKMWEYSVRGKVGNQNILQEHRDILIEANKIRVGLESYNSRAYFNNRNLEDVLSLLSFEAIADGENTKYETMVKAVARTIELSSVYQYTTGVPEKPFIGSNYEVFWRSFLGTPFPTRPALITFNYDLVFERTLWQYFHFAQETRPKVKTNSVGIKYHYGIYDFEIRGEPHRYNYGNGDFRVGEMGQFGWTGEADINIPYLKLHGSLNWDQDMPSQPTTKQGDRICPTTYPTMAVEKPLILPPVFNKMNSFKIQTVWKAALEILRNAKHIVIVGYSLPKTDIYMQYFLKSAIGPNSELQKIIVFDPILFQKNAKTDEMKQRYQKCFSPQFSDRIIFEPTPDITQGSMTVRGTFDHFVNVLSRKPNGLFFS